MKGFREYCTTFLRFRVRVFFRSGTFVVVMRFEYRLKGLCYGKDIEVLYTVERDGKKKEVWWPGKVTMLWYVEGEGMRELWADVEFKAKHGFPSVTEEMVFKAGWKVVDEKKQEYVWRVSKGISEEGGDEVEEEYVPEGRKRMAEVDVEALRRQESGKAGEVRGAMRT